MKLFLGSLFLTSSISFAKILTFDVSETNRINFSPKEVCQFLVKRESPLIDIVNTEKIDCMGTIVKVSDFCKEKLKADPFYARGFIKNKKIICQSASKIVLRYECEKNSDYNCRSKVSGCDLMQEKFANGLEIVNRSIISKDDGKKILSCLFSRRNINSL